MAEWIVTGRKRGEPYQESHPSLDAALDVIEAIHEGKAPSTTVAVLACSPT